MVGRYQVVRHFAHEDEMHVWCGYCLIEQVQSALSALWAFCSIIVSGGYLFPDEQSQLVEKITVKRDT